MPDTPLTPANQNPFYLLATTYGEHETSFDGRFEGKNQRIWNGFMAHTFPQEQRDRLATLLEVDPEELRPLSDNEIQHIEKRFELANIPFESLPSQEEMRLRSIRFHRLAFDKPVLLAKRVFPFSTDFSGSRFSSNFSMEKSILAAAHFSDAVFERNAYFHESKIGIIGGSGKAPEFRNVRFSGYATFSKALLKAADFTKSRFDTAARFDDTVF